MKQRIITLLVAGTNLLLAAAPPFHGSAFVSLAAGCFLLGVWFQMAFNSRVEEARESLLTTYRELTDHMNKHIQFLKGELIKRTNQPQDKQ